ncbi:ead/Ea22-like family protein [Citrobacter freundii]|uniref:ead/Ea22-like family protein n=1 Tax=Citrobacter freundii TaxID=546 RepID=UPI00334BF00F
MGSNIIELAKLGHDRASELKASCGAVDARSLAQLISDLATQLEVQLMRGNAQAVQLANAESKCRELAAENAATDNRMQQLVQIINNADNDYCMCGDAMSIHTHGGCGHPTGMFDYHYGQWMKSDNKTPATDAFLAEVLASARNEGINYAASRLATAFNHGFVDKPLTEVCDVVRMILDTKEELANSTLPAADGISGEYAEKFLADFAAQLRKGDQ